MNTKTPVYIGLALVAALCVSKVHGQTNIGQWDFKKGDLSATAGSDLGPLSYFDGPNELTSNLTKFATTAALGVTNIAGVVTNIMEFPGSNSLDINAVGYIVPLPPGNGGGDNVNNYTIIVDVLYTNTGLFRPILEMDDGSLDLIQALFAVNIFDQVTVTNTSGSALPSLASGHLAGNTWYRLGFVLNTTGGEVDLYTNGGLADQVIISTNDIDGAYSLYTGTGEVTPLFSSSFTNVAGFANSVQLRDTALNAGQMAALGGPSPEGIPITIPPVKTFVQYRDPEFDDVNVLPYPNFNVILNQGDTVVDSNSIELYLDGTLIPSSNAPTAPTFTITASLTNLMAPGTLHTVTVAWTDSVNGPGSNSWSFTVLPYQSINLPQPFYLETFDEVPDGGLPTGWYATNATYVQETTNNLCDPDSASYENWLVITTNEICGTGICSNGPGAFECDTLNQPPIELNGALITNLASNSFLYFETDNRCGSCIPGQVGMVFTPDIDCSGQSNVYVCFNSLWMQNRNSFGSLEYSIDQGTNWLPALYCMADSPGNDGRVIYTNGVIDATATFETSYTDQAGDTNFARYMAAPVSQADVPFIQLFPDDGYNYTTTGGGVMQSQWIGKEIEEIRLVSADFQSHVRFRFGYEGRCSWYWGVDNFGLYSINTPDIGVQPQSVGVDDNATATLSVVATGAVPLTYQWQFDGTNVAGATNSAYIIGSAAPGNAGTYTVIVSNQFGPVTSDPATLTVFTTPDITNGPVGEVADVGGAVTFTGAATGAQPLSYLWLFNDGLIQNSAIPAVTLSDLQLSQAGNYQIVASNSFGAVTSTIAILKVWAGPITSNLVVHLPFDGNFNDTSGRGNNAAYATNGPDANPNPTFAAGKIGQAFQYTTTTNASIQEYATLGYPMDLQFGATNDFSVSMWVNYTNQNDDLPFICNKDWNSSSDIGWGVFCQSGGNFRINVSGPNMGEDKFSESDTPDDVRGGAWHNIMVSFQRAPFGSSAFVYAYLDGDLVSKHPMGVVGTIDTELLDFTNEQFVNAYVTNSNPSNQFLPDNQITWAVNVGQDGTGVYHDQGGAHDIGALIDDVGVWRRALTANEAKGIYQAGEAGEDLTQAVTAPLVAAISSGNIVLTWQAGAAIELQTTPSLSPTTWTVVPGSLGASSASIPMSTNAAAFFRLFNTQ